ncbi:PA14 domain-containing protein [Mesobacillus zeae]|uniref:Beta-N-acetylglucosaminidase n=1 Tax=Mesobacillus zeae TaxID=1917180 RepID=A0A398B1I2_9BACI|nr:PA14 domain-containing protein [Mesobacillus zeae]RID81743.1 hypothetical protein D1970_21070 [Mesobacillus zeae]
MKIQQKTVLLLILSFIIGLVVYEKGEAETFVYNEKTPIVEYNWGKGGPAGYTDNFEANFDQSQYLNKGNYFIQTLADDGVTVDVDKKRVIDRINYSSKLIDRSYLTDVQEGNHEIITHYKEGTGNASVFSHVVPFDSWLGYYYQNTTFSGAPIGAKIISGGINGSLKEVNGFGSPLPDKLLSDNFSVKYYSAKRLAAGEYVVRGGADDGLQVFIDGKLVLDRFTPTGYREDAVKVTLNDTSQKDIHLIEVRYKEGMLSSRVNVSIEPYREVIQPSAEDGWVGEVFAQDNFSGSSIILGGRNASNKIGILDFDWKSGSPGINIPKDNFSARFYRKWEVDKTGVYSINIWADDKTRVYIDGKMVVDSWKYIPGSYRKITLPVIKGAHEIRVDYGEAIYNARIKLAIEKEEADFEKTEPFMHYNWGLGSPINKLDHFTGEFNQSQYLGAGDYFVQTLADDGIFMDFDGQKVIDRWTYIPNTMNRHLLTDVDSGNHNITTLYREGSKSAMLFSDIVPFGNWLAYYYNNDSFSGAPAGAKVIDAGVEYGELTETNGQGSPLPGVVNAENFTAKYVTAKRIPAGDYVLRAGADDGLQVYIDGELVLDRFSPAGYREDAAKVTVSNSSEGSDIHWVEVKYKEGVLGSRLNVSLQPFADVMKAEQEFGWVGEVYPNQTLSGNPVILGGKGAKSLIGSLDFNWGTESPSPFIPSDGFSARFTKKINIADAGYYVIKADADDGVRVYVDDRLVMDSWNYQSPTMRKSGIQLSAGTHTVRVEYNENKLGARLSLNLVKGKTSYGAAQKTLRYNWGLDSPDVEVQPDYFTAMYDQSQYLESGDYFLQTLADDGITVDVNGNRVIDRKSYSNDSIINRALLTNLSAGNQKISTAYYEGIKDAALYSEVVKFGDWLAYYYPNQTLSGIPVSAKVLRAGSLYGKLAENNGMSSPVPGVVPADNFSARYVTAKRIPAGDYVLRTGADDGLQVYVDGELVLDRFTNNSFREDSIKLNISDRGTVADKDVHWIEVRYKEASSSSRVEAYLQPYSDAVNIGSNDGWFGEFYKNTTLSGNPVIIGGKNPIFRVDSVNFNWGQAAPTPLIPADYFSARFTKKMYMAETGDYVMTVYADDGVRVKVDGITKIDSWQYVSGNKRQVILRSLPAGVHTITIEYYDGKLGASVKFDLQKIQAATFIEVDLRKPSNITAQDIVNFFNVKKPESPLKAYAQDFIDVQNKSGVNAQYLVAHAIWETGWGSSTLTKYKRNFFGYGAYDSCPFTCAYYFPTGYDSINYVAYQVKTDYLTPGGRYYNGPDLIGMNVKYATDPNWKNGIANLMEQIKPFDAAYYNKVPANTVKPPVPPVYSRNIPAGSPVPSSIVINFPAGIKAVTTQSVNFRNLPYVSSSTYIAQIPSSTSIVVEGYNTDVRDSWYRANFLGKSGWVSGDYITIQNLVKVQVGDFLNIRTDATTSSASIKTVPNGTYLKTALDAYGKKVMKNGWYKVYVPGTTQTGWVSGSYVGVIQ